ncbi:hypothetical protein JNB_11379 [Janibacter sp. HTCC2649]|nr:hypothetical protein JNB_11379 [Janibacter sp. HTCC2649]
MSGSLVIATTAVPPAFPGSVLASGALPAPLEQALTSTSEAAVTAARLIGADGRGVRIIVDLLCLGDRRNPTAVYAVTEDFSDPVSFQPVPPQPVARVQSRTTR